ncbi:MAG: DUF1302 domain-containing protein [Parvibaculum sp.]|nr:DUF1302 domain-containing protein [Parvibaculum sp.]
MLGTVNRSILIAAAVMAAAWPGSSALAVDYKLGSANVSVDTTMSFGVGVRTKRQSCAYISVANGGCASALGVSPSSNTDDGNINFGRGDLYTARAKFVTDIEGKWENFGAFTRVKGFYDYIGHKRAGEVNTPYGRRPLEDVTRGDAAHSAASWNLELLDAFVYGNFDILGGNSLNVRLGRQVVNWGESLVIPGGINQYQPVDISALRTPGAEIKEALLPVEKLYVSLNLPANMNVEGWVDFKWRSIEADPVGTLFSPLDFYGPGGAYINLGADTPVNVTQLLRAPDDEPDDFGAFGLKFGYLADWLNDGTELGLYYVRYSSVLPILEIQNGLPVGFGGAGSRYRMSYPEGVEIFGFSFATVLPSIMNGTALSGEVLYQPDLPFQISNGELFLARQLLGGGGVSSAASSLPFDQTPGAFPSGYLNKDAVSGQIATLSILPTSDFVTSAIGADLVFFIANWGFQWLPDISETELRALSASRSETQIPNPAFRGIVTPAAQPLLHPDSFSHGIRLIANAQYNNAFGTPVTLTPSVQLAFDFGTSAGFIGPGFLDDRRSLSLGLRGTYNQQWSAGLQWTATRGNAFQNIMSDRDFLTFDVSYAF